MLGSFSEITRFHEIERESYRFRDVEPSRRRIGDVEARELMEKRFGKGFALRLSALEKIDRDKALSEMRSAGLSVRQLQRLTGIGFGIIARAKSCI